MVLDVCIYALSRYVRFFLICFGHFFCHFFFHEIHEIHFKMNNAFLWLLLSSS